jgi:hypothetical protein
VPHTNKLINKVKVIMTKRKKGERQWKKEWKDKGKVEKESCANFQVSVYLQDNCC